MLPVDTCALRMANALIPAMIMSGIEVGKAESAMKVHALSSLRFLKP